MKNCIDLIFILLGVVWLLPGCAGKTTANLDTNTPQSSAEIEITQVNTVSSTKKTFYYYIQATGKIASKAQSKLQFRQNGFLEKIYVSTGQKVVPGQLIAQLDKTALDIALQKAIQQVNARKVAYQDLLIQHKMNLKDETEIDPKLREYFRTDSGLAEAELLLKEAQLALSYATLHAPIGGVIADLKFKPYNQISTTDVLCLVYADNDLELTIEVLESEVTLLQKGLKASIKPISKSTVEYAAVVSEINPYVTENALVQIKLKLLQTQGLLPGMNASAEIAIPQKPALVVPKSAIVVRSGKKVVFTEEKGLAKWNYVETGLENETEIEIVKGLDPGKKVIINHNLQLDHDSPVKTIQKP
ncbi:MAG: efflux RND transporter periplasmic adaptor subunit [Microscillaceae bacterium]|nr:efflux RND transporter periplasmic adaptor subunit [Microscillaceae bacterium]